MRAGHRLIEAITDHLRRSDHGVTFTMLRPVKGQWPPVVVMRADFEVAASVDDNTSEVAAGLGLETWLAQALAQLAQVRRARQFFTNNEATK